MTFSYFQVASLTAIFKIRELKKGASGTAPGTVLG
jgi:hypothetical protein